ncbi:MAG: GNAT family N-acetyltransferase [Anaerolineae bacterium]|nr:GNAT family N-acetyltransferase [Anaerolineae bacterium]
MANKFRIDPAKESDWDWIAQGQAEIVWIRLGPECQQEVSRQAIDRSVAWQLERMRGDTGFPSKAFVARVEDGSTAGFVLVAKTHNDATGQLEASLLSQYVSEPYRGQGLGHRLMEAAEDWARQQGLPRIALSVGVLNTLGQKLYESLGYHVETLRMSKKLDEREPDAPPFAND